MVDDIPSGSGNDRAIAKLSTKKSVDKRNMYFSFVLNVTKRVVDSKRSKGERRLLKEKRNKWKRYSESEIDAEERGKRVRG